MSLHLSKCHIVGNHMSGLNYYFCTYHICVKFSFNRDVDVSIEEAGLIIFLLIYFSVSCSK